MDKNRLKDTLQAELERLSRTRDELRVQAALGKAETRTELNRLDAIWQQVHEEVRRLGEQAKGPAAEIGGAVRSLVEELAQGYGRIRRELDDAGLNVMARRSINVFATAAGQRDPDTLQAPVAEAERAATESAFVRVVDRIVAQIGGQADVRSVFANPVTKEGVTVIPVARVVGGFGAGAGSSPTDAGSGIGGGGGFSAQPIGFIEIDRHGARFRSIANATDEAFDAASFGWSVARRLGRWALDRYKRRRGGQPG